MRAKFSKMTGFFDNGTGAGWFKAGKQVLLRVPGIKGFCSISKHTIDADGEVNPSVMINGVNEKGKKAHYHKFIILKNWNEEEE